MRNSALIYVFVGLIVAVLLIAYFGRESFSDPAERYFCYPQQDAVLPDGSYYSCLVCVDRATGRVDESCNKFEN
jgi:hypothetical protein